MSSPCTARAGVHSTSRTDMAGTPSNGNRRPRQGWGTLRTPAQGLRGGHQHSRIHIREELQLAGEDLRQQHPYEGPIQGTET